MRFQNRARARHKPATNVGDRGHIFLGPRGMTILELPVYPGKGTMTPTTNKREDMRALVIQIAKALVDDSDAVDVEEVERDEATVLRLRVAPTDVGKVIGKQGRTARSVRTILGAVSMKHHHRYTLDILEEAPAGATQSSVAAVSAD